MNLRVILISMFFFFGMDMAFAADPDFYRSTGKIYGAYGVALLLVLGLISYLFSIDRKLTRIEEELEE